MAFDLWSVLGVSPRTGLVLAGLALLSAVLMALVALRRQRRSETAARRFNLSQDD